MSFLRLKIINVENMEHIEAIEAKMRSDCAKEIAELIKLGYVDKWAAKGDAQTNKVSLCFYNEFYKIELRYSGGEYKWSFNVAAHAYIQDARSRTFEKMLAKSQMPVANYFAVVKEKDELAAKVAALELTIAELRLRPGGEDYLAAAASFDSLSKQ